MRAFSTLLAAVVLLLATPAAAHRLDEYLQAAVITVEQDRIALELRLTPGVDVAQQLLAGLATEGEQRAYAAQVVRDLSLAIDGHAAALRLIASSFPEMAAMAAGTGDIVLQLEADMPPGASSRSLVFETHHRRDIAVYLVNCLMPRDPAIRILGQARNPDQSSYRLDFAVGGASTPQSSQQSDAGPLVVTFFRHGIHHILTGYDHLLFIGALVLGAATLWDLVKVVTAFTVAHSITLTLAALDLVQLPAAVVEPLIAASIVFVAVQNIVSPDRSRGLSRLVLAFGFGLFHGLGFAGGLLDIMHQMPRETILLAIFGFSLGIEAGNQMVLLPLFGVLKTVRSLQRTRPSTALQQTGSAAISAAGLYYLCLALAGSS